MARIRVVNFQYPISFFSGMKDRPVSPPVPVCSLPDTALRASWTLLVPLFFLRHGFLSFEFRLRDISVQYPFPFCWTTSVRHAPRFAGELIQRVRCRLARCWNQLDSVAVESGVPLTPLSDGAH